MKQIVMLLGILVLGAVVLSPAIAYLGFTPMPGDLAFGTGNQQVLVPVAYSLCASAGLALLYYLLKR